MAQHLPASASATSFVEVAGPDLGSALLDVQPVEHLSVLGPVRDLRPIARMRELRILELRSVRIGDLTALQPLQSLQNLQLRLGSIVDLSGLVELSTLQYVESWMVRNLHDVSALGQLPALESFFLQDQPKVNALPDLTSSPALKSVWLWHMRGITDLRPLKTAPALAEVNLVACQHMQPDDFAPLLECHRLKTVNVGSAAIVRTEQFEICSESPVTTAV